MAELELDGPPRRRPPRCRMMHPFVEERVALLIEQTAARLRVHPDQLAAYIIESVMDSDAAQRLLKL